MDGWICLESGSEALKAEPRRAPIICLHESCPESYGWESDASFIWKTGITLFLHPAKSYQQTPKQQPNTAANSRVVVVVVNHESIHIPLLDLSEMFSHCLVELPSDRKARLWRKSKWGCADEGGRQDHPTRSILAMKQTALPWLSGGEPGNTLCVVCI